MEHTSAATWDPRLSVLSVEFRGHGVFTYFIGTSFDVLIRLFGV